jgi:integrase
VITGSGRLSAIARGREARSRAALRSAARHRRNLSKRGLDPSRTRAGLQEVTFLALRHTFASILIAQGNDVVFVSRQLGHSKVSHTLDMYADLFHAARHAREARDGLERDFRDLLRRHGAG